jgi:hypothetical protein
MSAPTSPQLVYNRQFGNPYAGQLGYAMPHDMIKTFLNKSGGTLGAGLGVVVTTANSDPAHEITLPSDNSHPLAGITVLDMATDPNFIAGTASTREGESVSCLLEGSIWVVTESVIAVNAQVYVRYASGTGTTIGAFTGIGTDTNTCRLLKGARMLEASTGSAGTPGTGLLYFSAMDDYAQIVGGE